MADDIPPGRRTNPSAPARRIPLELLALAGLAIAAYLTAYQVGLVPSVWEPLFGDGSRRLLDVGASALAVPDASLGVVAYVVDLVLGAAGGPARWRTAPRIVVAYAAAISCFGAVSVALVVIQPVVFGTACTLCLASAAVSICLVPPALVEASAALHVVRPAGVASPPRPPSRSRPRTEEP